MRIYFFIVTVNFLLSSNISEVNAAASNKWLFEKPEIKLRVIARSQDQMAAFYEARGFPPKAIKSLEQFCFFTVGIANTSKDVLWLDMSKWNFESKDKNFKRFHRDLLKKQWQDTGLEQRLISTFRWTLLPEILDFQPRESEGGNIVVLRSPHPFNIKAAFTKGRKKDKGEILVSLNNVHCGGKI